MKRKKWHEFRQTFFLTGLVTALALCNLAFSYTSYDRPVYSVVIPPEPESTIIIPPTVWEDPEPDVPKPPKPKVFLPKDIVKLLLVDDPIPDDPIDDSPEFLDTVQAPIIVEKQELPPVAEPVEEENYSPVFFAERMPCFKGCEHLEEESERRSCTSEKLLRHIHRHIKYPSAAREIGLSGTVVVRFVVSETGQIEHIEILRSLGGGLDKESIRIVNSFPEWSPGKQNGRPVKVIYTFPFRYELRG